MCLILIRDPGVPVNYDNLEATCENNPHGWGYVIPDRGKLEIRRFYNNKGNDPAQAARVIEDNPNSQIFMHFRYCTHGEKNKDNVHPFPVLTQRKDGMQVWLMHNGTVNGYKEQDTMSDTFHFTQKLVAPVLRRFIKYTGKQRLLSDPLLPSIIEKFAGSWSKFVLIDDTGNYQIIGDGHEHSPGLWVSNEYSFKPKYRYPTKKEEEEEDNACKVFHGAHSAYGYQKYGTPYAYQQKSMEEVIEAEYSEYWNDKKEDADVPPFGEGSSTTGTTKLPTVILVPSKEVDLKDPVDLEPKETFCDLLGMKDIREICLMAEEDIFEMVIEYPEHMTLLIRDLALALDNE